MSSTLALTKTNSQDQVLSSDARKYDHLGAAYQSCDDARLEFEGNRRRDAIDAQG